MLGWVRSFIELRMPHTYGLIHVVQVSSDFSRAQQQLLPTNESPLNRSKASGARVSFPTAFISLVIHRKKKNEDLFTILWLP